MFTDAMREAFIEWSADMDLQYDRVFSIIDIQKRNMKKWGRILPFYQNVQNEGVFFGGQLKRTCLYKTTKIENDKEKDFYGDLGKR